MGNGCTKIKKVLQTVCGFDRGTWSVKTKNGLQNQESIPFFKELSGYGNVSHSIYNLYQIWYNICNRNFVIFFIFAAVWMFSDHLYA